MAQPADSAKRTEARTVSLVLGSGGARGLAHIVVIEELEAHGYEVRALAGSSMGALIGGIFALSELTTYRDWVKGLNQADVIGLLNGPTPTTTEDENGEKADEESGLLRRMMGYVESPGMNGAPGTEGMALS